MKLSMYLGMHGKIQMNGWPPPSFSFRVSRGGGKRKTQGLGSQGDGILIFILFDLFALCFLFLHLVRGGGGGGGSDDGGVAPPPQGGPLWAGPFRGGGGHSDDFKSSSATSESQMAEMPEAQILEVMGAEQGNARVQFLAIKVLVNQVWTASMALKMKRDCHRLFVGTAAHPISPWHEVIHAVVGAMETHPDDASVTQNACVGLCFYFDRMFDYDTVSSQRPASTIFPRVIESVIASLRREKAAAKHVCDTKGMMVLMYMVKVRDNSVGMLHAGDIDVLQSVLLRHPANQTTILEVYKLLNIIATYHPMELAVSSSMLESLRQAIMDSRPVGMIMWTMQHITMAPPAGLTAPDAVQFREHTHSNITALIPGLGWILTATQIHMKDQPVFVFACKLLTNMAENAVSNETARRIIECLGFSVVLDGTNCFRFDDEAQLYGAKAMWALLRFGGVDIIEEYVKQRALQTLWAEVTRFDSVDEHAIRTVARKACDLLQPHAIEVDE